jgi:hypothetical protein
MTEAARRQSKLRPPRHKPKRIAMDAAEPEPDPLVPAVAKFEG